MKNKIRYHYHNIGKVYLEDKDNIGTKKALDMNMKFLRDYATGTQEKQAARSKNIRGIAYLGLNAQGDVLFTTKSEDGKDVYLQSIRFYDVLKRKPRTKDEILDMMKNSDIGVYCNDPSFLYWGAAYNATVGKYNIIIETRPPKGMKWNNPKILQLQKEFVLCKHLIAVLKAAPFYWNNIVGDYAKMFKADFEEREKIKEENPIGKVDNTLNEKEEGRVSTAKVEVKEKENNTSTEKEEVVQEDE